MPAMPTTAIRPCGIIRFAPHAPRAAEAENLQTWLESTLIGSEQSAPHAEEDDQLAADLPRLRHELQLTYQRLRRGIERCPA